MRKLINCLVVVLAVAIAMVSCKTKSDYTPYISISSFLLNPEYENDSIVGCEDTVKVAYDASLDCYVLDTVSVSDTVVFVAGFGSRCNDVLSATITADTMSMAFRYRLNDDSHAALQPSSSEKDMKLYFNSGYNFVCFPVTYIPKKPGAHKVTFTVTSDSKFSPATVVVMQNVR